MMTDRTLRFNCGASSLFVGSVRFNRWLDTGTLHYLCNCRIGGFCPGGIHEFIPTLRQIPDTPLISFERRNKTKSKMSGKNYENRTCRKRLQCGILYHCQDDIGKNP